VVHFYFRKFVKFGILTLQSTVVAYMFHPYDIRNFFILSTDCVHVFHMNVSKKATVSHTKNILNLCNGNELC
jgi:hypothetical protein